MLATCHFAFPRSAGTQGIARGYRAGFLLVAQRARNSLMHALVGNKDEEHNANNIEDFFEHRIKLSRNALLGMRTSGYTADFTPPRLQPTPRAKRTGDRVEIPTATGQKIYRSRRRTKPRPSGRIRRISLGAANSPAPPQRGTPGVTSLTNQECKPQLPPKGRGSRARCQRRRLYRQWRRLSGGIIPPQASGRPLVSQRSGMFSVSLQSRQGCRICFMCPSTWPHSRRVGLSLSGHGHQVLGQAGLGTSHGCALHVLDGSSE